MSSFTYDGVGLLGMLLLDHPESPTWISACTTQLDRELENWASADGAWIESIHYTLAAWNEHAMSIGALKHPGIKDYYRHPKTRKFLNYYLAMQTPPDPEFNRQRGLVQIGNSYVLRPWTTWRWLHQRRSGTTMPVSRTRGGGCPSHGGTTSVGYGRSWPAWAARVGVPRAGPAGARSCQSAVREDEATCHDRSVDSL